MSKLEELYETREKLQSLGIAPNADLERQLEELEEEIIRNEIVPIITDKVEPVLKQVSRTALAPTAIWSKLRLLQLWATITRTAFALVAVTLQLSLTMSWLPLLIL